MRNKRHDTLNDAEQQTVLAVLDACRREIPRHLARLKIGGGQYTRLSACLEGINAAISEITGEARGTSQGPSAGFQQGFGGKMG